jgi:hypothetical protein
MWDLLAEQLVTTREYLLGKPVDVADIGQVDDDQVIAELMKGALCLSINEVARHVQMTARRLRGIEAWGAYVTFLRSLIAAGGDGPSEAVRLLSVDGSSGAAARLSEDVLKLCHHEDYVVSWGARSIASEWGLAVPAAEETLPAFYTLALPDGDEFTAPGLVAAAGGPMHVDDPLGWTYAFRPQILMLSEVSGISVGHIRERCHMYIRQWGGVERFGESATTSLKADLDNAEMRIKFNRPHMVVAARALRYVAGEFFRARRIPPETEVLVLSLLGHGDDLAWMQPPATRPAYVRRPMLQEARWSTYEDDWLADVEGDIALEYPGAEFLLAETTTFEVRRHRRSFSMTRVRAHHLPEDSAENWADSADLLPQAFWIDGPFPRYNEASTTMAVQLNSSMDVRVPSNRLIVCPIWADRLRWQLLINDQWLYMNERGAIMARSVWWRDGGPVDVYADVIWGEGSILLLSPQGRAEVEAIGTRLGVRTYARRQRDDSDGKQARFAVTRA